jgi:hypothetical protein
MNKKFHNAALAAYAAGALATFGPAWQDGRRLNVAMDRNPADQVFFATTGALFAAAAWPLYWSVRLAEPSK